jgi:Holliday junction DNA helicase RuvB
MVCRVAAGRGKERRPAARSQTMKPPINPPEPRYVTVACEHCDGGIEFDAYQLEGDKTRIVECPHCHLETTVFDPEPETPIISPEQPANESQDEVALALPPLNLPPPEKLDASRAYVADIAEEAPKTLPKPGKTGETNASANNKAAEIQPGRKEIPPHEAFDQLLKAAARGQAQAEYSLGLAYFKGLGVSENHAEAVKWWHKAAEQGHAAAQINLSKIYETGDGAAQDFVAAYKWAKLAAAQGREEAHKKCEELVLKMNPEQIGAVEPKEQILWKRERLMPKQFSDFIGQKRARARLELAVAAAKSRGEALGHVLLIGSPGLGTATLAHIVAQTLGANFKSTCGYAIQKAGGLADLLTGHKAGDVLFIDGIHLLRMDLAKYLYPAMKDFKLDLNIDEGPNARSVRQNLPRFTLIGTMPRKGRLPPAFLSCFSIIENMDPYNIEELTAIACRFARLLEFETDGGAADQIARSADGTPLDVLRRLRHVQDFACVKGSSKIITADITAEALKMLIPTDDKRETNESPYAIPFEVRIKVWRRDNGKCVKCGTRQNLEFDHIIPVSKGGSNTARNVELLCEDCNRLKSDSIQ